MTASDWKTAAKHGCPVCFCPRSNHNLNVGPANVEQAAALGMTLALGTDSLASNSDLDLFEEASFLMDRHPGIRPELVLRMLTLGGAEALGQSHLYGSIEPGKQSFLLSVDVGDSTKSFALTETLIRQGRKGAWQWANYPGDN
jgi:cytosine/adenosine deaminase-related metal-dependent hydrolase